MSDSAANVAGVVALIGTGGAFLSFIALHALPTGLSPATAAVSQYGISRLRIGYRILTIGLGAAGIAISIGLSERLKGNFGIVSFLLVIFGFERLSISWFPMDQPGTPRSITGRRHGLLAFITFLAITLAALRLPQLLDQNHEWLAIRPAATTLSWCLLITMLAMLVAHRTHAIARYFGSVERAFYAGIFAWLALIGSALVTNSH